MKPKLSITIVGIGLGRQDISASALRKIAAAQVLLGGSRQLALFPEHGGEKIRIGKDAAMLIKRLSPGLHGKNVAVLASGDPNFHGIASLFYQNFPNDQIEIIPNITAFQAAFARIKMPWDGAAFASVHGRSIRELDALLYAPGSAVVYCDARNTPSAVAAYLIAKNSVLAKSPAWVFDSLGTDGERIISGTLKKMIKVTASPLSLLILKNGTPPRRRSLGIPDECFAHDRAMITRRDVRLMTLARLELNDDLVLWDIGAGSGSVAIEAANAYPGIQAYAVEKNARRFRQLNVNIRRFYASSVHSLHGEAAAQCAGLPRPDRIFIGGSGGELEPILKVAKKAARKGSVIVVNCVTPESLFSVLRWFKKWQWRYDVTSVSTARLMSDRKPEIFRSENPVFIVQGRSPVTGE